MRLVAAVGPRTAGAARTSFIKFLADGIENALPARPVRFPTAPASRLRFEPLRDEEAAARLSFGGTVRAPHGSRPGRDDL